MLKLTTEALLPFIGGQLEIQNPNDGYLVRGEIEHAVVENGAFFYTKTPRSR